MKQSRIEEIVGIYTKGLGLSADQLRLIHAACEDVERETRHELVSMVYDLANKASLSPRDQETKSNEGEGR